MASRSSLRARAALAIALMALFYALAIGAIVGCVGLGGYVLDGLDAAQDHGPTLRWLLGISCVIVGGVIAWSIMPRPDRFQPPGPELTAADAPALFAEIQRLAQQTGQAAPARVYLSGKVNAFVARRGGFMGFGSRRVMGIGLPLLALLGVDELRAVLAHEHGHGSRGEVALGPWIYRARGAVFRSVDRLGRVGNTFASEGEGRLGVLIKVLAVVRAPFHWFALGFTRMTQPISEAQERTADALAARVVGPGALVEGLQKVGPGTRAFRAYVDTEVTPALDRGLRPPIVAGFLAFLATDQGRGALEAGPDEARAHEPVDPHDAHPSLRERISAFPDAAPPADRRPAIELLGDIAGHEARLLDALYKRELHAIAWPDVAARVHVPQMRDEVERARASLADLTPATLPRDPVALLARLRDEVRGEASACVAAAERIFGAALLIALVDAGGAPTREIAQAVVVRVADEDVDPFAQVRRYLIGEIEPDAWLAWVTRLGIADTRLDRG
ncbi:MAG: M48 family metalloprotease [Deltaproteobacteria bacterium]|nr:M48 family metalloprotease [Deltaproteobacteria bacterium]